jgi:hypothetical protein
VESRIKIKLIDWQDPRFVRAFDVSLAAAFRDGLEADRAGLAERVEAELHRHGYPLAWIDNRRSVADVLARIARWTVWRDRTLAQLVHRGGDT